MKNGFTLVELLAVLIILAVISLISVPVITDVIDNSKKNSIRASVEHYIDAINAEIANQELVGEYEVLDGVYQISMYGKTLTRDENTVIYLDYKGDTLEEGYVVINGGVVRQIVDGKIDNWYTKIVSGKVQLLDKLNTMLTGKKFNIAIKTLVNNAATDSSVVDTTITKIAFYDFGKLPEGYTKEQIEDMKSIDVSVVNDGSIVAYYDDNDSIYVLSEGIIKANSTSSFMFYNLSSLKSVNVENLDTSNVTDMEGMFAADVDSGNLMTLKTIIGIENFNTFKVTIMKGMFQGCADLTELDLSNFNTVNVTDISYMFKHTSNIKCIKVGSSWNIANVTTTGMFLNSNINNTTTGNCKVN